jgi:hypothetical protein
MDKISFSLSTIAFISKSNLILKLFKLPDDSLYHEVAQHGVALGDA